MKEIIKREKYKSKCKKIRILNSNINEINCVEMVSTIIFLSFFASKILTSLLLVRVLVCIVLPLIISGTFKMITIINDKRCKMIERKINIIEEKINNDFKKKDNEKKHNDNFSKKKVDKKAEIIYLKEMKKAFEFEEQSKISRIK